MGTRRHQIEACVGADIYHHTTSGAQGGTRKLPQVPTLGGRAEPKGQRRGRGCRYESYRLFEARSIQIPALPQVPQFRACKLALRDPEVQTSAPDGFLRLTKKSYGKLSNRGLFPTLGPKLVASLSNAMTGDLGRQICLKAEAGRKGQQLKGR